MVLVELCFPAGRYHATGWGRHVNEGVPEWPPSPYRLVRAVYDAWKRKRPGWEQVRVERILAALSSSPPRFRLPEASVSHTRAYLDKNTGDGSDRTLIFDAFVVLPPRAAVLVGWPDLDLDPAQQSDLGELLAQLNYLGRSESWIAGRLLPRTTAVHFNCAPVGTEIPVPDSEVVAVASPVPRHQYEERPFTVSRPRGRSAAALSWMQAIAFSTADLLASRCSGPPSMSHIDYLRPRFCTGPVRQRRVSATGAQVHGVLYALESKVLPLVTDTVVMSERARVKLMGIHKKLIGAPGLVSPKFSGKDVNGKPLTGHRHAFLLPCDTNRDGRLDHLLVVCREPFDELERLALDALDSLWQAGGRPDIRCLPVRWGSLESLLRPVRRLMSLTPFVPARHYRRGRGPHADWVTGELVRECRNHGLPEPIKAVPTAGVVVSGGRMLRWLEFRRSRREEATRLGYGFELEFPAPVRSPVALGYACHFGLGLFGAVGE